MRILFCFCLFLLFPSFSPCDEEPQPGVCTGDNCELRQETGSNPILNEEPLLRTPEEERTNETIKPTELKKINQTNKTPGNDPYDSWE
ncbi:hypothetical protein M0R36_05085 [bacterium]|nr:hypothetical protein [bacterium]